MYYEDRARRTNFLIALALGSVLGGAVALVARADIRFRRPPTTGERAAGWAGSARDRVMGKAADAVTAMTGALPAAAERFRG
jgi:hypothetical protein